jgi:hypothetical protein
MHCKSTKAILKCVFVMNLNVVLRDLALTYAQNK